LPSVEIPPPFRIAHKQPNRSRILSQRESPFGGVQLHFDVEMTGKSTIVVLSNAATGKWETSLWDFFLDGTFAVIDLQDNGKIKPTRFEFIKS
jgi:hypothetical protein